MSLSISQRVWRALVAAVLAIGMCLPATAFAVEPNGGETQAVTLGDGAIDISNARIKGVEPTYGNTGEPVTPDPRVTVDGVKLKKEVDYTLHYENSTGQTVASPTDAGEYCVVITGINAYTGVKKVDFRIADYYFEIYAQWGESGTPVLLKGYTKKQFEELQSDSTDPVSGLMNRGGTWNVATAKTYVTLADLMDDADINENNWWYPGCLLRYGGDPVQGKAANVLSYDEIAAATNFYPGTTASELSVENVKAAPAVFAIESSASVIGDNGTTSAADAEAYNLKNASKKDEPRFINGVSESDYLAGQAIGKRLWSMCSSITIELKPSAEWTRLSGDNRYETMVAITKAAFEDGSASNLYLTSGENFADALTASALVGGVPLITTPANELGAEAAAEIERLAADDAVVHIIGGENSVAPAVAEAVAAIEGVTVDENRIAGNDRIETGLKIAQAGTWGNTCIVADIWNYADALSIGSCAFANKAPIFGLTTEGTLNENTIKAISDGGFTQAIIVGGINSVPAGVETQLTNEANIASTYRLAGDNRLDTSAQVIAWATGAQADAPFQPSTPLKFDGMGVADAWNYPDALTSINLLAAGPSPLLLVDESGATIPTNIDAVVAANSAQIYDGYLFGGENSVSELIKTKLEEATTTLESNPFSS